MSPRIGTLSESSLHAGLKAHYAEAGDAFEVPMLGKVIDIVREGELVEIQTGSFSALRRKLPALLAEHRVTLVYPVVCEKWLVKLSADGEILHRRKSPKRGRPEELFKELVAFPDLLAHPGFSLEVALVQAEEIRRDDGQGSWRRRGVSILDRRLVAVVGQRRFERPADLLELLPDGLPDPFTTADLAGCGSLPRWLCQKMAYCLREAGLAEVVERRRAGLHYRLVEV